VLPISTNRLAELVFIKNNLELAKAALLRAALHDAGAL